MTEVSALDATLDQNGGTALARFVTVRPPVVARVGFDHGWHCLSRHFLNFASPVLLVDRLLLGPEDAQTLGLEPFGVRDPRRPLPEAQVRVHFHAGSMVGLYADRAPEPSALLAWHRYDPTGRNWRAAATAGVAVVLLVGDTYTVENNWATVWDCHIGLAQMVSFAFPEPTRAAA